MNPGSDYTYRLIEAVAPTDRVRRAYDLWSTIYAKVAGQLEYGSLLRGFGLAGIGRDETVLKVALGTGAILLEILKKVDRDNTIYGIDPLPRMIERTRRTRLSTRYFNTRLFWAGSEKGEDF